MVIAGFFSIVALILIGFIAGIVCTFILLHKLSKWKEKKTKEHVNDALNNAKQQTPNQENKEYTINEDGTINVDAEVIE